MAGLCETDEGEGEKTEVIKNKTTYVKVKKRKEGIMTDLQLKMA
jgi:hypothetical protein